MKIIKKIIGIIAFIFIPFLLVYIWTILFTGEKEYYFHIVQSSVFVILYIFYLAIGVGYLLATKVIEENVEQNQE